MVVDCSQTINSYTLLDAYHLPRLDEMVSKSSWHTVFSSLDVRNDYHQIAIAKRDRIYIAFRPSFRLNQFCSVPFEATNGVACFECAINRIIHDENLACTFAYIDNLSVCGMNKDDHDENLASFLSAAKKCGVTLNEKISNIGAEELRLLGYEVSHGSMKPDPERFQPLRELTPPVDLKSQQRAVGLFSYFAQMMPPSRMK